MRRAHHQGKDLNQQAISLNKMEFLMKSELDLFVQPKLSSNILKTEEISFKPLTSLENQNFIEFSCNSVSDAYLDLSSTNLRLTVQFLKKS